jgi:hypothetical protein
MKCVNYPHLASEDVTAHARVRVYARDGLWTFDRPLCFGCTEAAIENAIACGLPYAVDRIETEAVK